MPSFIAHMLNVILFITLFLSFMVDQIRCTGADPENVEPGGANSINYQTEQGGATLFFCLTYKGEQGGVRRVHPSLNPRLWYMYILTTRTFLVNTISSRIRS